jgi:16S rRNA processing protein RimM
MVYPTDSMNSDWITLAVLGPTHANRGEITGVPLSGTVDRFQKLCEVWLFGESEEAHRVEIVSVWEHGARLVFKFKGIDNISDAEKWRGAEVRVPVSQREPLEEGEFYLSELIGCEVWDRKVGDRVGSVTALREFGGPGLLELDSGLLIPYAKAICVRIDTAGRRIDVELPEGLRELNQP